MNKHIPVHQEYRRVWDTHKDKHPDIHSPSTFQKSNKGFLFYKMADASQLEWHAEPLLSALCIMAADKMYRAIHHSWKSFKIACDSLELVLCQMDTSWNQSNLSQVAWRRVNDVYRPETLNEPRADLHDRYNKYHIYIMYII